MLPTLNYTQDFIPPRNNKTITDLTKLCLPLVLSKYDLEVRTSPETRGVLDKLANDPTVIMPNHSDRLDPLSVFSLSKICHESFYYVAARETFDENLGLRGLFFQNLGAYSVMRGVHDLKYVQTTISLLMEEQSKIVLFGEGRISGRDDAVGPIKQHAVGCLYMAQEELLKRDSKLAVHILPLAIYYQVDSSAPELLVEAIDRIEISLGLSNRKLDLEARTERAVQAVISQLEQHFGLHSNKRCSIQTRSTNLTKHLVNVIAKLSGIEVSEESDALDLLYHLRSELRKPVRSEPDEMNYLLQLRNNARDRNDSLIVELDRMDRIQVLTQIARQQQTFDTTWRMIDVLAHETRTTTRMGRRTAWLEAGKPINLLDTWDDYKEDSERTIKRTTSKIKHSIDEELERLKKLHKHNSPPHAHKQVENEVSSR